MTDLQIFQIFLFLSTLFTFIRTLKDPDFETFLTKDRNIKVFLLFIFAPFFALPIALALFGLFNICRIML